jgi:hypothetical protein
MVLVMNVGECRASFAMVVYIALLLVRSATLTRPAPGRPPRPRPHVYIALLLLRSATPAPPTAAAHAAPVTRGSRSPTYHLNVSSFFGLRLPRGVSCPLHGRSHLPVIGGANGHRRVVRCSL